MTIDLILGTAGHIDHGKTSLIRALTGVDTDRLPEEKRRGITIELGFAELLLGDYRLGIVDVPGHERFVRNMLCGATGMDLALLVVAADDSIKPQTREHLEILRLLDLPAGVIALTKADLVDDDWLQLVGDEIRELVAGTFLESAPIVPVSSTTGRGLAELRTELAAAAARAAEARQWAVQPSPFRLAIDRAFTIAGHGTVVTGSVSRGRARVGDELAVEPGGRVVRVRGLRNHDRTVDEVHRGQRAAINLVGIHHDEVRRGQELCTPGHLVPSRLLTAELHVLPAAARPLKDRARVRIHVGTAELSATVRLLSAPTVPPGGSGLAQLFLSEPAVTVWRQPFVVRSESPVFTIGGGRVLHPNAARIRQADEQTLALLERLRAADPVVRGGASLYFAGLHDWSAADFVRSTGHADFEAVRNALLASGELVEIEVTATRVWRVHRLVLGQLCDRVARVLGRLHDRQPLRTLLDRAAVMNAFRYLKDEALVAAALRRLAAEKRIRFQEQGIGLTGRGPKLTQNEQKLLTQLAATFQQAGLQPPTVKECQQGAPKHAGSVEQLLTLLEANGELVRVSSEFFLHADAARELRDRLREPLRASGGLTISQMREILNVSRKYAVPFAEYLDKLGFTQRRGDARVLGV